MKLWILGCRGSSPAPGPATVRYGGNTSALAVSGDGDAPTLLLDAGTGLVNLPGATAGGAFRGAMLLTHLHWDHTHGLPFSPATDDDAAEVSLHLPAQGPAAAELLAQAMSPPAFPIGPDGLRGAWSFSSLEEGRHELGGFEVLAREIPHKGGRTFGYRITAPGGETLAYMPDHQPSHLGAGESGFGPVHDAARELADRVDVLVHDAQYTDEEFVRMRDFGHSAISYAVELARRTDAGRLVAFHHAPTRTDTALDHLAARYPGAMFAREGAELVV